MYKRYIKVCSENVKLLQSSPRECWLRGSAGAQLEGEAASWACGGPSGAELGIATAAWHLAFTPPQLPQKQQTCVAAWAGEKMCRRGCSIANDVFL